jgi:hypothetical protein
VQADVGPRRQRPERLGQAPVELDRVQVGGDVGEALAQHPFPGADLEHHVVGAQLGVADDRVEQVRVGQEVLPEPDHRDYQPKSVRALASTVRSSSA